MPPSPTSTERPGTASGTPDRNTVTLSGTATLRRGAIRGVKACCRFPELCGSVKVIVLMSRSLFAWVDTSDPHLGQMRRKWLV